MGRKKIKHEDWEDSSRVPDSVGDVWAGAGCSSGPKHESRVGGRSDYYMVSGGSEPDALEEAAVTRVVNAGKILVAAAGNDGTGASNYPASYDGVISVGAVTKNKDIAYFSNYNVAVDICAPGDQVYTTNRDGGYTAGSGTSLCIA